jgi:integrase
LTRHVSKPKKSKVERLAKTWAWVQREPKVKAWYTKISIRSEQTGISYAYHLQRFLEKRKQTVTQFLDYCEKKSAQNGKLWVELRDEAYTFKPSMVKSYIKAFKSFLVHYGIFLPQERLPTPKPLEHKELPYEDVKKIVNLCPEPYRTIFTIFTYAPMGEVSFVHWNSKADMAKDVQSQLGNKLPYIKIIHPPRKNATKKFYSLIPKAILQDYLDRGNKLPFLNNRGAPVDERNIQQAWARVREGRAGFKDFKGVGPHEIRDSWFTWAGGTAGGKVGYEYRKFTIGHSDFSEQGYNKLWENEAEVYSELRKAWEARDSNPEMAQKIEETSKHMEELESTNATLKAILGESLQAEQRELQDQIFQLLKERGLATQTPIAKYPPDIKRLQDQLTKTLDRLVRLGLVKPGEEYG